MKAKLKDLLRRALVGLLSVSMIAADLPVAVFAAEPTEATAVEATATEETTAATEAVATEAAATEAVEATEAVVTEATATEAVEVEATEAAEPTEAVEAETVEETDEADADKEAKEEVKAEETFDAYGNNPKWDTYFLTFNFGEGDDAKAAFESMSKNGITAGTQLTDAKSDAVTVNKRDEKDTTTFGVPVNGTGVYWLEYAVSVNVAYRQSISENGFTGLLHVDGFKFDGDKYFEIDPGIGYWDFSKASMYIYAQKNSRTDIADDKHYTFYYSGAKPYVAEPYVRELYLGNGSSDDNIKFEVAYASPLVTIQDANGHDVPKYQPVWYTVGGKTEFKFANSYNEFWLRVSGFQNDLSAYSLPTAHDAYMVEENKDQKYYIYHYTYSSNFADFIVGDAKKAPFYTFNVHNAGSVPIAFQYKTKVDGTLTKLAEIPAGGQLNSFTVNSFEIDQYGISFNASATDHAYYKWAVKNEANLFTNATKQKTDEKALADINLTKLKKNAYTEKKGSGENEEYVIDIWLKEAPEFDALYAFTGFDYNNDAVYVSNDPELLRGDMYEVAAREGTTGSKKFVYDVTDNRINWTLSAGEKIYVRMFNRNGSHFSAELATLASKESEVNLSPDNVYYSVSENSDADVVRKNTELIALGDDIYSLEFKSASTKGMTDKALGITVKKVSAVHALKVNVDDGVAGIAYGFAETVNGKERFYTLKGIGDKDDAYFRVALNPGYKIVSVKNAEYVSNYGGYRVEALTSDAEVTVVTAKDNASTVSINFAMAPSMDAEAAKAISVYRVTEGTYSADNSSNYSYIGEYKLGTTYGFTSGQKLVFVLDDTDYRISKFYAEDFDADLTNALAWDNANKTYTYTVPTIADSSFDTTDGAVNNVYIYVKKVNDYSRTYTFTGDLDHVAIYTDEQGDHLYNDKIEQNSYTTTDAPFNFIVIPDPGYVLVRNKITGVANKNADIFTANSDTINISAVYNREVKAIKSFKIKTDGTIEDITIDGGNIEVTRVDKNNFVVNMTSYEIGGSAITHYMMFKYDDKEIDHLNIVEPHAAVDEETVIRYNLANGPYPLKVTDVWEGGTMNISADFGFSQNPSQNLEKNFYGISIFNEDALSVFGRNDIYLRKHDDKDSKVEFTLSGDYARYASVSWDNTKDPRPVYDLVVKRIDTKVNELALYREDGSTVDYIVDDDGNFVFEDIDLGNGWTAERTFDMYVLKLFRHIPGQTFRTYGDVKLTFWTVENGQKVRLTDPYLVTANETETNGSFYRITGFTGSYTVEAKSESGLVLKGFADAEQHEKYSTKPEEFAITPLASFSVADGKADAEYYGFMQPYFKVWLSADDSVSQLVTNGGSVNGIPAGTEYKIQYFNGFGEKFTSAAEIPASLSGGMTQGKDIFSDHVGLATVFIDQVDAGKTLTYQYKLDKGNTEFFPDGSIKITTASAADTQYSLTTKVDTVSSCEIKTPEIVNPDSVTLKYDPLKIDGTTDDPKTYNEDTGKYEKYTRVDQIYENKGKAQILTYPTTDAAYKTQETSVSMNVNGVTVGNIKVTIAPPEMNGKTLALNADKLKATTTGDKLSIVVPTPEELGFKVDETVVGRVYWKVTIKGDVDNTGYNTQYFNYYKLNGGAYELDENGRRVPVTSVLVSHLNAAQEYKFTLQLVQTGSGTAIAPEYNTDDSAITEATVFSTTLAPDDQWFTVKTKTEYYATKLKLSKKSATIYTGQQDLYVCDVTLPEKELVSETLDVDRVVQLAQVGTTGSRVYTDEGWIKAEVRDGKLYLSVDYDYVTECHAGKYTMEVRTKRPDDTYWATARFNLTVKQGIQTINLNLKNKIYVPSGSTTTLKVKPTFNELSTKIYSMEKINDTLSGTDLYNFAGPVLNKDLKADPKVRDFTCITAPAAKKLDWANAQVEYFKVDAVADKAGQEYSERAGKNGLWLPYDGQGGPSFSIAKNGTIKVSGSGDSETWYRIKVKAADYKDSKIYSYYNSEFQVISNDEYKDAKLIVIDAADTHVNDNGLDAYRVLGTYGDKNKITLKSTELDAAKDIRVVVDKDSSRNSLAAADGVAHEYVPIDSLAYSSLNNFNIGLEFKPVKSKGFNLSKEGFFTYKHAKDSKKITATTLNGSLQKKLDATIAIEYEGPKFGLEILDEDEKVINYKNGSSNMGEDRYKGENQDEVVYYGTEADFVGLRLMIYNPANSKEGIWTRSNFNDPNGEAKNFTITVKGGKLQKPVVERNLIPGKYTAYGVYKNASVYYLNVKPNNKNGVATITVKNKLDKTSKTYYVTNKTKPGTGKVKVTSNRKNLLDKAGEDQTITFKPSGLDESQSQYYLKIDRVQKNVYSGSYEQTGKKEFIDKTADYGFSYIESAGRDALKVDELIPVKQSEGYAYEAKISANCYVYPGNYKYVFTYGTLDAEGNFVPATKAQNYIIKIKGDKTTSFKIKTNYKLAARDQYKLEVEGKSKGVEYVSVDEVLYANVMGNSNKFKDLITINKNSGRARWGYGNWYNGKYHNDALAINAFAGNGNESEADNYLTIGQLKIDLSKITSKVDLTGYIKYTVHYKATGWTGAYDEQKYAKIKITLGKDEAKTVRRFKAKSNGAMMNQDLTPFVGYIELTAGGKPVSLSDYVGIKSDNGIFTYAEVMDVEAVENELGFVCDGTKKYVKIYSSTDKAVLSKIFDPVKAGKQKIKSENVTLYVLPQGGNIYYNVVDDHYYDDTAQIQKDKNATMDYVSEYGVPVSCKVKLVPAASATKALSLVEKKVPSWDGMFTGKTYNTWNYENGTWYAYVPVKENLAVNGHLVTIKAKDWCDNPKYSQFMSFGYDNSYKDKAYMVVAIGENELKKAVEKNVVKYGETADVALSVYLGIEPGDVKKDTEASIKDWTINVTLPDPYAGVDPNAAAEAIDKDVKKLADAAVNTDAKRGQLLELIDIELGDDVAAYEDAVEDAILENIYGNVDDWSYIVERNWNGKSGIVQNIRTKENELIAADSATKVDVAYDSRKNIATVTLTRNSLDGKTSETRDFRFSPNVKKNDKDYSAHIINWLTLNRKSFNNETDPKEIAKAVRTALNVPENIGITAEKVDAAVSDSKLLIVRFTLSDLYETDTDATFTAIFSKGAKTTLSEAYAISIAAIREGFTKGYTQGLSVSEDAAEVAKAANAYVDVLGYEVKAEKDKEFDDVTSQKYHTYHITVTDKATKAEKSGDFFANEIIEETGYEIINFHLKSGAGGEYINPDYLKKNKYGDTDYTYDAIMAAIRARWPEAVFEASKDDYKPVSVEDEGKIKIKASASANGASVDDYEETYTFKLNPDKATRYTASDYVANLGIMKRTLNLGEYISGTTTKIDFNNTDWVFRDFDNRATESASINGAGRGYTRTISTYEYVAPTATDDGKVSLAITVSRDGETASTTGLVMVVKGNVYNSAADVLEAASAISVTAADASEAAYQKKLDAIKFNAESVTVRAGSMVKTAPTKVKDGTVSFVVDATVMQGENANKASLRITYTLPAEGNQLIAEAEAAAKAEVAKIQKELNDGTLDWKDLNDDEIITRIARATKSSTLVSDDYSAYAYNDYNKKTGEYDEYTGKYVDDDGYTSGLYFSPVGKGVDGFVKGTVVLKIRDAEVYVPIDLTIPAK